MNYESKQATKKRTLIITSFAGNKYLKCKFYIIFYSKEEEVSFKTSF